MPDIYVKMRDGEVDRSSCLGIAATADYDVDGGLVGIEILGGKGVTVDGRTVFSTAEQTMGEMILDLPMRDNDAGADTVRGYLCALLAAYLDQGECFSGKAPFGEEGWQGDLYLALVTGGVLTGEIVHERFDDIPSTYLARESFDRAQGNRLIRLAVEALAGYTVEEDEASRMVIGRG